MIRLSLTARDREGQSECLIELLESFPYVNHLEVTENRIYKSKAYYRYSRPSLARVSRVYLHVNLIRHICICFTSSTIFFIFTQDRRFWLLSNSLSWICRMSYLIQLVICIHFIPSKWVASVVIINFQFFLFWRQVIYLLTTRLKKSNLEKEDE